MLALQYTNFQRRWSEIQIGLYGTIEEQELFTEYWMRKAREEIKESDEPWTWTTWEEVAELQAGLACMPFWSDVRAIDPHGDEHPDMEYLGRRCWIPGTLMVW